MVSLVPLGTQLSSISEALHYQIQDDCRDLNVSFTHLNASGVDDVFKFLHKLSLRTALEVTMLNDALGNVKTLVRPNSYKDVQKR